MSEKIDATAAEAVFPGPIRHKPEYFITEKGRMGVYYLVDHLLRAVCWGQERDRIGTLSIDVKTDSSLILKREFPNQDELFPELPALQSPGSGSLANDLFRRCVQAINSRSFTRHQKMRGNPFLLTFLPMVIALSSKAKLKFTEKGSSRTQNFKEGLPIDSVAHTKGENTAIELEVVLDSALLEEEVRAYPFRIRIRELACLFPGIEMDIRYKGFAPSSDKAETGMKDLVDFIVPEDERLHDDPFVFHRDYGDLTFEVALYLVNSEMEKIKAFAGYDETYHGGVHDECLREVISDLFFRLYKFQLPDRRQSLDNIAASRMTYFGSHGSTVPFQKEHRGHQFVKIVPGVTACLRVVSPELQWEKGGHRSRLLGPSLQDSVQPDLTVEFRRWLLEHPELFSEWQVQWAPKKRRKRGTSSKT